MAVDSNGNIYVNGRFENTMFDTVDFDPGTEVDTRTGYGMYLSKFDSNGDFLWARTWGADPDSNIWISSNRVTTALRQMFRRFGAEI